MKAHRRRRSASAQLLIDSLLQEQQKLKQRLVVTEEMLAQLMEDHLDLLEENQLMKQYVMPILQISAEFCTVMGTRIKEENNILTEEHDASSPVQE